MSASAAHATNDGTRAPAEPGTWERLNQILEDLPPGYPILSDEDRDDFTKYQNTGGPRILGKEEAWQNCARAIEKHDTELCKGYREEIDTLLVFAGLFSAVATAFTIESYQWLQDDPNDAIISLLSQIALSVALNDTATVTTPTPSGLPGSAAVRINAYWFLALTLSLSSALVAILCKQWLREFERNAGYSSQEYVGVRQVKFEGFEHYGVGQIVSALPLLLQLSLAVFALGIVDLLWHLHIAVAIVVGVATLLAALFYVATAVLPAIQFMRSFSLSSEALSNLTQYPYKSPQAWLVLRSCLVVGPAWKSLKRLLNDVSIAISRLSSRPFRLRDLFVQRGPFLGVVLPAAGYHSWRDWDHMVRLNRCDPEYGPTAHARALTWLWDNETHSDMRIAIWNCHWHEVLLVAQMRRLKPGLDPQGLVFSNAQTSNSHRIETIRMLKTNAALCTADFLAEMFVQNVMQMDPPEAASVLGHWLAYEELDPLSVMSLVRGMALYAQIHPADVIDGFIMPLSDFSNRLRNTPSFPALRGCVATLIVKWIREKELPGCGVTSHTQSACLALLHPTSAGSDLVDSRFKLYEVPYVKDVAAMASAFFERYYGATGLRVSQWPPSPTLLHRVSEFTEVWGGEMLRLLFMGLFEISVCGVEGYAARRGLPYAVARPTEAHAAVLPQQEHLRSSRLDLSATPPASRIQSPEDVPVPAYDANVHPLNPPESSRGGEPMAPGPVDLLHSIPLAAGGEPDQDCPRPRELAPQTSDVAQAGYCEDTSGIASEPLPSSGGESEEAYSYSVNDGGEADPTAFLSTRSAARVELSGQETKSGTNMDPPRD